MRDLDESVFALEVFASTGSCINLDRVLDAVLVSISALVHQAVESKDLSDHFVTLIERLLTSCGGNVRRSCVEFIIASNNNSLVSIIATVSLSSLLL
jgi:hypothetical protein